jgi:hypothetical protein
MPVDPTGLLSKTNPADRRTAERIRILQRCLVRPAGGTGNVNWKAIAYDLSVRGIGLALPYPITVGTELIVEPAGRPGARALRARVVRFHPVSYLWFCGCELASTLQDAELQAWLSGPARMPVLPDTLPDLALL